MVKLECRCSASCQIPRTEPSANAGWKVEPVKRWCANTFMTEQAFKSFAEFWPYYLNEHSKPATRVLHCAGTLIAIGFLVLLIAVGKWWLFLLALVPGYGLAWIGHFFIEKNKPATFTYPLWSFMGDWKMLALMLTGRLR